MAFRHGRGAITGGMTAAAAAAAASASATQQQNDLNTPGSRVGPPQPLLSSQPYRRYGVGDRVLICNHPSRWSNLVNRLGFPEGEGSRGEERRGPYVYVLATVRRIHYGENAQYYTVQRADSGGEQRADAEWMEPIRSPQGEAAALKAASTSVQLPNQTSKAAALLGGTLNNGELELEQQKRKCDGMRTCLEISVKPLGVVGRWLRRHVGQPVGRVSRRAYLAILTQAELFLNGLRPYLCTFRMTGINLLVLCSSWYMFVDQLRLAFFPPSSDDAVAKVSCLVWIVLALELIGEVFIRPDGYKASLLTEKAYAPSTVRHINNFHLVMEVLSLAFFVPEFVCLFTSDTCGDRTSFSLLSASLMAVLGPDRIDAFYGRAFYAILRLRIFGLVRHWKQMWISASIADPSHSMHIASKRKGRRHILRGVVIPHQSARGTVRGNAALKSLAKRNKDALKSSQKKTNEDTDEDTDNLVDKIAAKKRDAEERKRAAAEEKMRDKYLTNATNIGTALMVINSHRALLLLAAIVGLLPVFSTLRENGGANTLSSGSTSQLQATNLIAPGGDDSACSFLRSSVRAWLAATTALSGYDDTNPYILSLKVLPVRCDFQGSDGTVTQSFCQLRGDGGNNMGEETLGKFQNLCRVWSPYPNATIEKLASIANVRVGEVQEYTEESVLNGETYSVTALFNQSVSVAESNYSSFLLQILLLLFVLSGLSILRIDAGRLVLGPLRRMLKIVSMYAKNPLAKASKRKKKSTKIPGLETDSDTDQSTDDDSAVDSPDTYDTLGNYETEQLISAVTKITDLLRKCWGVAGAGIVSSNLARQDDGLTAVFNPCVPGRMVYGLFGFAAIKGFDHMLRSLGEDIMVLINDVAAILHGECYRWGFGDSGQCNKNLGAAFLMVYRIGDVKEVKEKRDRATDVIFDSVNTEKERNKSQFVIRRRKKRKATGTQNAAALNVKKKAVIKAPKMAKSESLALSSLPGINTFTDRAVLGMLKTFAGIYRDQRLLNWKEDFRLGAGVGAFSVDMIFGMDAGWAVEGAVGSEHKIDATYLSPHVNMASRMMSACKQYGVNILVSQAVEELLSDQARSKFRHLDTVTVKGSSVKQKIFTYDSRHKGVDFFLFERSEEDADYDAERYTANIWHTDMDLRAMRQHVSDEFLDAFNRGRDLYLAGKWEQAVKYLQLADDTMVDTIMDEGYMAEELNEIRARMMNLEDSEAEEAHLRNEMGDGPSRRLLAFIESRGGRAPDRWQGYRPLTSK